MPRPLVQKKLGEILYILICSFLPCLSWLLRSRVRKSRRDLWITLYISNGKNKIGFGLVWANIKKTEYKIIIRPHHIRLSVLSSSTTPSVRVPRVRLLEKTGTSHTEQIRQCIVSPSKVLYFVAKCLAPPPQNIILLNTAKIPEGLDIIFLEFAVRF